MRPIRLNFYRCEFIGWYRLAPSHKHLQKGDNPWQCLIPRQGTIELRLPLSQQDRWVLVALALTGLSEEEIEDHGVSVRDTSTGRVYHY